MTRPHRFRAASMLLLGPALLVACGGSGAGSSDTTGAVEVVSTDDACTPAQTTFAPGKVKLSIKNAGTKATELYVYQEAKVVAEVENVGPDTSRTLSATLVAGKTYELACKPGGKTIKVPITVTA